MVLVVDFAGGRRLTDVDGRFAPVDSGLEEASHIDVVMRRDDRMSPATWQPVSSGDWSAMAVPPGPICGTMPAHGRGATQIREAPAGRASQ